MRIIPSLASANQLELLAEMQRVAPCGCLHLDIEDGNFVPNVTFGMKTIRSVAKAATAELDAHILATRPEQYIAELHACGVSAVSVQIEAVEYPGEVLWEIKSRGMRAGLAFNMKTDVAQALPFLSNLDFLLFMTAEPDGQGCLFNPAVLDKISYAREIYPNRIEFWADGGISASQLGPLARCGVGTVIMGREVWSAPSPAEHIAEMQRKAANEG